MRMAFRSCGGAAHHAARRQGRRPRGVVGEGASTPQEDEAVREIVAAFEQDTGKQVELVLRRKKNLWPTSWPRSRPGGAPRLRVRDDRHPIYGQWAYEGRLVDLSDAVGHFSDLFDPDALERNTLLDATTGQRGSTRCRWSSIRTMSTSGGTCSSRLASRSPTFPSSGMPSGPSGVTGFSRRCAGRRAATTSGASACPCRPRRSTTHPIRQFIQPTRPTT